MGPLNYWQTRYIPSLTGLDGPGLWITPGEGDLCMSDPESSGCGWPKTIYSTGFIDGTTSNGPDTTITGLVPDGNPTVTLVLADRTRKSFRVIDNAYEATVKGQVVAVIDRSIQGPIVRQSLR